MYSKECLDDSVSRFIVEDAGGSGRLRIHETIEECFDAWSQLNKIENPDKEEFIKKVSEYCVIYATNEMRTKRNELLVASDWTQMNDVKLEDDAAWKVYRQALRDLPSSVDVEKPVYPLKPGEPEQATKPKYQSNQTKNWRND